ncbi:uncharacterized protein LOC129298809 [Prosopis cineraria]|uniref:uncharacterized protein LOC129298809 n=1 Tax=Prosopis cineraria TaxID=364024 RepID=UPI00240EE9AA|nr:uncharacterized protein LOC129298809 [Prosopis cineraria]
MKYQPNNSSSSSCPVLRELTLYECDWNIEKVTMKIPTLTTLIIEDDGHGSSDKPSLICEVAIDSVDLASLSCIDYNRWVELVPINLTSLVEASIDIWGRGFMKETDWSRMPHCLKYSLKSFSISNSDGSSVDMKLLSFLLKNATFIERIEIFCLQSLSSDLKRLAEIRDQLEEM